MDRANGSAVLHNLSVRLPRQGAAGRKSTWDDIREVDALPAHIALPLRFIPFKPHGLLYVQSVCTIKYFLKLALQAQAVCRENLKLFMGVGIQ
jgi:hypothetical protein